MFETKFAQKIKTHILCSIIFFSSKIVHLWDNVDKYGTDRQATDIIRRIHFACWTIKAADTHSESVILTAFPRQQWLRERASMVPLYLQCLSFWTSCAEVLLERSNNVREGVASVVPLIFTSVLDVGSWSVPLLATLPAGNVPQWIGGCVCLRAPAVRTTHSSTASHYIDCGTSALEFCCNSFKCKCFLFPSPSQ